MNSSLSQCFHFGKKKISLNGVQESCIFHQAKFISLRSKRLQTEYTQICWSCPFEHLADLPKLTTVHHFTNQNLSWILVNCIAPGDCTDQTNNLSTPNIWITTACFKPKHWKEARTWRPLGHSRFFFGATCFGVVGAIWKLIKAL